MAKIEILNEKAGQYITPKPLCKGDKVAIVAPATHIRPEYVEGACEYLKRHGYAPVVSEHCLGNSNDYSGTAEERFLDLSRAFADKEIAAILCARGGYGAVHLIERFSPEFLRDNAKWLIGFSDITALHAMMLNAGVKSIHGAMAKYMWENPESNIHLDNLMKILGGDTPEDLSWESTALDIRGTAEGILAGGNMAVFNGLNGSRYDIGNIPGHILFIEDVGERPHAVERMLYNLKLGGVLEQLSGLIIGQFTEYEERKQLGKELYGAIADLVKAYDYPVCFNFPVGHVTQNMPLLNGAQVELNVERKGATLTMQTNEQSEL